MIQSIHLVVPRLLTSNAMRSPTRQSHLIYGLQLNVRKKRETIISCKGRTEYFCQIFDSWLKRFKVEHLTINQGVELAKESPFGSLQLFSELDSHSTGYCLYMMSSPSWKVYTAERWGRHLWSFSPNKLLPLLAHPLYQWEPFYSWKLWFF